MMGFDTDCLDQSDKLVPLGTGYTKENVRRCVLHPTVQGDCVIHQLGGRPEQWKVR